MKCDKHTMLLYAVTDRAWVGEQTLYQQVESALKGGATCVQLREKQLGDAEFLQEAIEIHALCQQYGVPLFINDNVDVAVKCHAEGIHVGQSDMAAAKVRERVGEDMMIGVSAHTVQEALDACGITLNKNCVPGDRRPPSQTSGVRIGTAAMTTRGYTAEDFCRVARRIDEVIRGMMAEKSAAQP